LGACRGEVRRRPAQDLDFLLELPVPLTQLTDLWGLHLTGRRRGDGPPVLRSAICNQRARQDSETPKLRATCAIDWSP
jgi:hypothetical protein